MANTTDGLPYPVGTDPVRDGDNSIQALAEALGPRVVTVLAPDSVTAATPAQSLPQRVSIMRITAAAAGGWPGVIGSNTAQLVTFPDPSAGSGRFQILAVGGGTSRQSVYMRTGYQTTWSPWSGPAPFATAAGQLTAPAVAAGDSGTFVVTFPANRFTVPPVMAAIRGHTRLTFGGFPSTTTSVTITAANYTTSGAGTGTVQWQAVQMTDTSAVFAAFAARAAGALIPAVATCQTGDCENYGVPLDIDLGYTDEDGNVGQVDPAYVYCGPCGQPCDVELVTSGE